MPDAFDAWIGEGAAAAQAAAQPVATRQSSQAVLNGLGPRLPELLGGSADLTGSNNTRIKGTEPYTAAHPAGDYLHYGVREFGMGAVMNGIVLHGGYVPFGGTFLVFSDYARSSLRMASIIEAGSIFVLTHDSIGLGEDGPTHQPVEHLASLRLIPRMEVWRPCDTAETWIAWGAAIRRRHAPTVLALTRQSLPQQPRDSAQLSAIARGGYVLVDAGDRPDCILIATGSEVALAVEAARELASRGRKARVVSMPCTSVFDAQDAAWRDAVLPPDVGARVAIEAGVADGWWRYVGPRGRVVGMQELRRVGAGKGPVQAFRIHVRRRRGGGGVIVKRRVGTMAIKVGINGYGRIGRNILRALYEGKRTGDISIVGINDLGDANTNAHLTRHDTAHGPFPGKVAVDGNHLVVNGDRIRVLAERDPAKLPWGELGADIVLECTGLFASKEKAGKHLAGGAKKVVVSAPADGVDATIVYGVNHQTLRKDMTVISNASCTTNCLAPLVKALHEGLGVVSGIMTTVHAYTNDQVLTDVYHSDLRRARSATMSMIPTKTGAAAAVGLVLPELKGKLDGFSVRVPTINVSFVDLSFVAKRATTAAEVNEILKKSAAGSLKGILEYTEEPLVSVDFNHNPASGTVDAQLTKVLDGTLVKVCAWYDNEWGFSNRMLDTTLAWSRV